MQPAWPTVIAKRGSVHTLPSSIAWHSMAYHNTALCDTAQQVSAHDTMLPAVAQLQATAGNGGLLAAHSCQVAGPSPIRWSAQLSVRRCRIQSTPCDDREHSAMKASPTQCAQPLRASTVLCSPTRIGICIAQPIWMTEQHDASSTPCVNEVPHMPSTHCSSAVKQLDIPMWDFKHTSGVRP